MAQNQTELWQMAYTFQKKHDVWLQFRKSSIGLDEYDVCKVGGEGTETKSHISNFPDRGSMCVVFCRTSAISLGHKALWCPKALLCKSQEGSFMHQGCHRIQLFLSYLWTTVIFILGCLLPKWEGDVLLNITQGSFLNFSSQIFQVNFLNFSCLDIWTF